MNQTKKTILCENRTCVTKDVLGEHGFSALIEKNGQKILMDTGQGLSLAANAHAMNFSLDDLDAIALSHGHYDHTGGLAVLPQQKKCIPIYAHPQIFSRKYSVKKGDGGNTYKSIGIKQSQEALEAKINARFNFTTQLTEIVAGVLFSGEINQFTDFERADPRLLLKTENGYVPDPLSDDASLLIETRSGPVILTGCAHSGIVNVMEHFSKLTGHAIFYAVIGGTHLGFLSSPHQLEKTMEAFDRFNVQKIAVSHCTGNEAAAVCYHRFKKRFAFANAGWSFKG